MLWGGRFSKSLNSESLEFTTSLPIDINMAKYDIEVSKAHCAMLGNCKIISEAEANEILKGLEIIQNELIENDWVPDENEFEDIHSAIEARLFELIGEPAGKLHTGRSRNDQVLTGFFLLIKDLIFQVQNKIQKFQKVILNLAEENLNTIMPGYTHLQRAQPISFGFHLMAYYEMLERDSERFNNILPQININPLGSCALAGSTLPLDRKQTASQLGFGKVSNNALDTVSNRDFVIDYLNASVILMMHLSRLAEEIIMWNTNEFNFISLDDAYSTGSSIMPQKKNPDIAELIRGRTGKIYGFYISVVTMMKGLPLSYNRDMQEDKEPVIFATDLLDKSLSQFTGLISTLKINKNRFKSELAGSSILATDLADYLVLKGIPFRKAHSIIGEIVKYCENKNKLLGELTVSELRTFSKVFDESVFDYLSIETALQKKKTIGSPNPEIVQQHIFKKKELTFIR